MESKGKRLEYSGITLGTVLVMAFVLVQPTMNQANAVGIEGLPGYDDCELLGVTTNLGSQPEDAISMNTVKNKNIVKTIHAEKEIFLCFLDQGDIEVIVDVTTYIEIYQDINDKEVIASNAIAVTCIKEPGIEESGGATVIDCESKPVSSSPVPVGSDCVEETDRVGNLINTHPQEMNTVNKGNTAKTIESQKEVFICVLGQPNEQCQQTLGFDFRCFPTLKKVEVILFTEIYENLAAQAVTDVQFHVMRCVILISNDNLNEDPDDDIQDAVVETCQFSSIEN